MVLLWDKIFYTSWKNQLLWSSGYFADILIFCNEKWRIVKNAGIQFFKTEEIYLNLILFTSNHQLKWQSDSSSIDYFPKAIPINSYYLILIVHLAKADILLHNKTRKL